MWHIREMSLCEQAGARSSELDREWWEVWSPGAAPMEKHLQKMQQKITGGIWVLSGTWPGRKRRVKGIKLGFSRSP